MIGLIKKDAFTAVLNAFGILPLLTAYWLLVPHNLDQNSFILAGSMLIVLLFATLIGLESVEAKYKGYAILSTLPLTSAEIIAARFIIMLALASLYVVYFALLFRLMHAPAQALRLGQAGIIAAGIVGLLLVAVFCILVIRFRYLKIFQMIFKVAPVAIMLILAGVYESNYQSITAFDPARLIRYTSALNIALFIVAGIAVYCGLWLLAVYVLARKENKLE